jgi:hypothetical protein
MGTMAFHVEEKDGVRLDGEISQEFRAVSLPDRAFGVDDPHGPASLA